MEDEKLTELRAAHGEVWTMLVAGSPVAFRCPTQAEYEACVGKSGDARERAPTYLRQLAMDVIVHPDRQEVRRLFEKRPGAALKVANEALRIANDEEAADAKKA